MSDVATVPDGAMFSLIERAARDETFDVAKFEALLRMRREEQHEQARRAFNVAMRNCQAEMEPVLRTTSNRGAGNKYAKLEAIDADARPIYTSHGFSVRYGSDLPPQPGWMRITCTVAHDAGYWEENYLDSPVSTTGSQGGRMGMTPVQAVGATVTYLRRYLLGMAFNIVLADIVGEDKDGEEQREPNAPPNIGKRAGWQRNKTTPDAPRQPPIPQTDDQWRIWLTKLRDACGVIYKHDELVKLAGSDRMRIIIAASPTWAHDEIDNILADNFERLKEEPKEEAEGDGDELPPIVGEDKLAAG